jgi:hypothetical protein
MSSTSDAPTPRPQGPRPGNGSARASGTIAPPPLAAPRRHPSVPPPLPVPARSPVPPRNRRATLPFPPPQAAPPLRAQAEAEPEWLELDLATPTPLPARLPPPRSPREIRPALPTPAGVTSFLLATPTPTMQPLPPPLLPARPAHRPPLRSRAERIERVFLQWLAVAAVGFVCGVIWHERHVDRSVGMAAAATIDSAPPVIVAIDNDESRLPAAEAEPTPSAAEPAGLPQPEPMIIEAQIPRSSRAAARSSARPNLRAAAMRRHAIR